MNGHGCPYNRAKKTPTHRRCVAASTCAILSLAALLFLSLATPTAFAQYAQNDVAVTNESNRQASPYRFRVSWGGGQNQGWQGSLSANAGTLSNIAPLGLNRDSSVTALQTNANNISIFQQSPTSYDGFDFSIAGPDDTSIEINLKAMDGSDIQWQKSIPITKLLNDDLNEALDELGHGISIVRVPGDSIQVDFKRDHLVFGPGERVNVAVAGNRMSLRSSGSVCRLSVVKARQSGPSLWTSNTMLEIDALKASTTLLCKWKRTGVRSLPATKLFGL